MLGLEEITIQDNLPQQKISNIENRVRNIISEMQDIKKESRRLGDKVSSSVHSKQTQIIDEISKKAMDYLQDNQKLLYETMDIDREFQENIQTIESGKAKIVTPQLLNEKREKMIKMQGDLIRQIEKLDFKGIQKLQIKHYSDDLKEISLTKIWTWVLESFYNTASSKFYWPEFKSKVFRDDGVELKRRMIIFSIKNLSQTLENELYEIVQVHGKMVKENYGSSFPVLNDLILILNQFFELKEQDNLYQEIKHNVVEDDDIDKIRQQKLNDLKTKQGLSSLKLGVLTDMNNLLNIMYRDFI